MGEIPPDWPFRNPPEVIARRDANAKRVIENFERAGMTGDAELFRFASELMRDIVLTFERPED